VILNNYKKVIWHLNVVIFSLEPCGWNKLDRVDALIRGELGKKECVKMNTTHRGGTHAIKQINH